MLVAASTLHEYFREALSAAMRRASFDITEHTQAYLVYLLSEFTRSEKVYAGVDPGEQPTLAFLLYRAQAAQPEEALQIFKHLGDSSLYLLGFFNDAAQAQVTGPRYYIAIGESAYSSAANLTRSTRDSSVTAATIYTELSDRFGDLVDLLKTMSLYGERSSQCGSLSPAQLLDLVERYRKTKNPELLEVLIEHGVCLTAAPLKEGESLLDFTILSRQNR